MENYGLNYVIKVDPEELVKLIKKFKDENLMRLFDTVFASAICHAFSEIANGMIYSEIMARDYFDITGFHSRYRISIKPIIGNILMPKFRWDSEKEMVENLVARGMHIVNNKNDLNYYRNKFEVFKEQ